MKQEPKAADLSVRIAHLSIGIIVLQHSMEQLRQFSFSISRQTSYCRGLSINLVKSMINLKYTVVQVDKKLNCDEVRKGEVRYNICLLE